MLMKEERMKIGVFLLLERRLNCLCEVFLLFSFLSNRMLQADPRKIMKKKKFLSRKIIFHKNKRSKHFLCFTIHGSSAILIIKNYNNFCVLFLLRSKLLHEVFRVADRIRNQRIQKINQNTLIVHRYSWKCATHNVLFTPFNKFIVHIHP